MDYPSLIAGVVVGILGYQLLRFIFTFAIQEHLHNKNRDKDRKKHLDFLAQEGIRAYLYFPSIDYHDRPKLAEAMDSLTHYGYVFAAKDGQFVGRFGSVNMTSEEAARLRRSTFKIVE